MSKRTPIVGAKGRFTLKQPFITPNGTYTCKAVRSITDLYRDNVDVFNVYYEPNGLTRETLRLDEQQNASIVTLVSQTATGNIIIYVPDTYIESYPEVDNVNYSRVIFSVDFGILPDALDLSHVESMIKSEAVVIFGKEPEVKKHIVEFNGFITVDEHEQLETSRLDAIANSDTERAKRIRAEQREAELQLKVNALEQLILDSGILN